MSDYTVGQRLGDYEILGILGAGGMGKVYKVRNTISERVEAMKILLPDLVGQKELADRFLREIKVLASLNHPNIAALRTALTLDNQLVMIMEFVDGVTLSSRIQHGAIPPVQAVKCIDQVLEALSYAHKQNIIHRDIKPANMMLMADGTVKLMDFGIARSASDRSLTMTGTTLGSLNYMPPEQVKGDPADNRSDLYSLGISLYEMVTGQLPFQADSNYAIMAAHLQEMPPPPIGLRPDIPPQLNQIILMALAKDPAQRFQSADAFRGALKSVSAQGSGTQPDVSPRPSAPSVGAAPPAATLPAAAAAAARRPPGAGSSHRGLYIALGAFIVVAVLFVAGLYLPGHLKILADRANSQAKQAQPSRPTDSSGSTPAPAATTPSPVASPADSPSPTPGSTAAEDASANPAAAAPAGSAAPQSGTSRAAPSGQGAPDSSNPSSSPTTPPPISATTPPPPQPKRASKDAKPAPSSAVQPGAAQSAGQPTSVDRVPSEDAALVQENEQRYDDMDSRSAAVSQSLDTLKHEQAAAGYGLRGDIVSAEARMKNDLAKAQTAMQSKDTKSAKKYLDMAGAELRTIEKFLGH